MIRQELLDKLTAIAPALARETTPIAVLNHFCFTGKTVFAYNDIIAMSVPCETEFVGAVPGKLLMKLLATSQAKDIKLDVEGSNLLIHAAGTEFKLATLTAESFLFTMPEPTGTAWTGLPIGPGFWKRLHGCMRSIADKDTMGIERTGVTLSAYQDGKTWILEFDATDGASLSHASQEIAGTTFKDRVILPGLFCGQLFPRKKDDPVALEIHADYALFVVGELVVFGKLINAPRLLPFAQIINKHFPAAVEKSLIPVPASFKDAVTRATAIVPELADKMSNTRISIEDGIISCHSRTPTAEITDVIEDDAAAHHPGAKITLNPHLLKRGLDYGFKEMLISSESVVLTTGDEIYLVAKLGG